MLGSQVSALGAGAQMVIARAAALDRRFRPLTLGRYYSALAASVDCPLWFGWRVVIFKFVEKPVLEAAYLGKLCA